MVENQKINKFRSKSFKFFFIILNFDFVIYLFIIQLKISNN